MENKENCIIQNGVFIKYEGDETVVTVPDGVTEMDSFCFEGTSVEEVYLPESIRTISGATFTEAHSLVNVFVDDNNPCFTSFDGCVYSKDMKRLIRVPSSNARKKDVLRIPEGVEVIESVACWYSDFNELILPTSLKKIETKAFLWSTVQKINLGDFDSLEIEAEGFYESSMPAIVDFNLSTVSEKCFFGTNAKALKLGENVKRLQEACFSNCPDLRRVYIGSNVDTLDEYDDHIFCVACTCPHEGDGYPYHPLLVIGTDSEESTIYRYCQKEGIACKVLSKKDIKGFLDEAFLPDRPDVAWPEPLFYYDAYDHEPTASQESDEEFKLQEDESFRFDEC